MTSLGDSGCFLAFGLSSLGGAGLGFEVWLPVAGDCLGHLPSPSIHEDSGRLHAVVGGGVFADALSDILEHVDDFACAVGFG